MPRRIVCEILLLWVLTQGFGVAAAQTESPHSYLIRAALDPSKRSVNGRERIVWTNTSDKPVRELYFHLYMNAFESDRTVFMRESGGALRGVRAAGRGRIDVTSMALASGRENVDLLASSSAEIIRGDRTQMRVRLPRDVSPGGRIVIEVAFTTHLPPLFARAGHAGDFFMVAQWFPKLARLEPNGGWASFPYHARGEFYADFARYEVHVTTPSLFVVGATGEVVSVTLTGATVQRTFVAERVHDFAFAAWPHFEEHTVDDGGVRLRVLAPPGYEAAVSRHIAVTRAGLRRFGNLFGRYPYRTLTVIVPPRNADGAAGMEYPMMFVTAGPWFTIPGVHMGLQDDVTAHELAHQWFQGMVATNEVQWPMLDEGLATWATLDLLRAMYGERRSAIDLPGLSISGFALARTFVLGGRRPVVAPAQPAYAFRSDSDYGRSVYGYTALVLETIGRRWGSPKLRAALGRYTREHAFGHPDLEKLSLAFDETYWPGFSKHVLVPALEEANTEHMKSARVSAQPAATVRRWPSGVFAWLLHAFQTLLGACGP